MYKQTCCFAAAICVMSATLAPQVRAATETAKSADAFVDSIGINTHYGNSIFIGGNAYANPAIDAKLAELGVRHIRDHSYNNEALAKIDSLYANYGIKANLILGETTRSPADLVNLLKAHPGYEGIEGFNEPDFNTRSWNGFTDNPATNNYSGTRAFQNELYALVKADPLTADRTILSPAMGTAANSQYLAPINFDVAAMHYYSDGREPSFGLDTRIGQMATLRGSKPLMATETGYFNEPAAQTGAIPENISAKYMPRLYAEYFNRGIARTYGYELADQGPNLAEREQNFGLLRFNMTEKPAFTAMENLIDLLEEPGASFTPTSLSYTLSGATPSTHHTLLQKSDGTFYMLLWQELPAYNRFSETEIVQPPLAVTMTLGQQWEMARIYLPNVSANATATFTNVNSLNLSVPDQMMIVELVPEPTGFVIASGALSFLSLRRSRQKQQ